VYNEKFIPVSWMFKDLSMYRNMTVRKTSSCIKAYDVIQGKNKGKYEDCLFQEYVEP
jgi:hypothetical protein